MDLPYFQNKRLICVDTRRQRLVASNVKTFAFLNPLPYHLFSRKCSDYLILQ